MSTTPDLIGNFKVGGTASSKAFVRDGPPLPRPSYGDPKKLDAAKLCAYQEAQIPWESEYLARLWLMWRQADLYDQAIQWIKRSFNIDPVSSLNWSRLVFSDDDPNSIPTPVFNEFSTPIENEASRLGKPEYEPYVRSDMGANLRERDAAELAQQVLQFRLGEMGWTDEEDRMDLHMPLYGGAILISYWDQTFVKDDGSANTSRQPKLDAMKCPNGDCSFTTANPTPPKGHEFDDMLMSEDKLARCPTCKDQQIPIQGPSGAYVRHPETDELMMNQVGPELVPFTPIEDELYQKDFFQRDLGRDVPVGMWVAKAVDPRDFFPDRMGVDRTNTTLNKFTYCHIEDLDWICNRYANGYLVHPEDIQRLMQYHPIMGERALYENAIGSSVYTGRFIRNCALVKETVIKPWMEPRKDEQGQDILGEDGRPEMSLNKGRYIVTANQVVLFDGDLMIESKYNKGKFIERVHLEYIPWKLRSGGRELFGVSLSEQLFDPQDALNEVRSQTQDARQSEAQPKWLNMRGTNFMQNGGNSAGAQWEYDPDPQFPTQKPERIESNLINGEIYREIEDIEDHIARMSNTQEVETGGVPDGVTAALALQLLAEQTSERRRARLRRMRMALERIFTHGLKLMHELCDEEMEVWIDKQGDWKKKSWTGMDLCGKTDVHILAESDHNSAIVENQAIRDAIAAGLFDENSGMSPQTRRVIADQLEVKSDVFKDQNLQYKSAEREWLMLIESGEIPVIDNILDSDKIHAEQHGLDLLSDKGQDMIFSSGWRQALPKINGWNEPVQMPTGQIDPMTMQPGVIMVSPFDQVKQTMMGKTDQEIIVSMWTQMISAPDPMTGMPSFQPQDPDSFGKILNMMAHLEAHTMGAEAEMTAAATGQQQLAEAGAPASAGGTIMSGSSAPAQATPGLAPMTPGVQ